VLSTDSHREIAIPLNEPSGLKGRAEFADSWFEYTRPPDLARRSSSASRAARIDDPIADAWFV
jgi:hypothetical protein